MSEHDDKAPLAIQVHSTVPLLLSTFLSPLISSLCFPLFLSPSPLPHATFQPPFSFSSSSSSSSCQAFVLLCLSDTFLRHAKEREKGKKRREKRGKASEIVRDKSAGHFLSHCCGGRDGESESAKRAPRDQRQTQQ